MTTFEDRYDILELAAGNNFKKFNTSALEEEDLDKKKQRNSNKIKMQRKKKYAWKHGQFIY